MEAERWQEAQRLFDEALEIEPGARREFIARRSRDPELAAEVLAMLDADRELEEVDREHDFFERTVLAGQTLVDPTGGDQTVLDSEAPTVLRPSSGGSAATTSTDRPPGTPGDPAGDSAGDLRGSGEPTVDFGKYRLFEKVGAGGFGQVYRARDPVLGRDVAIKTCTSGDQRLRQRFLREAKISAGLQHSNIVTVFDFGYHGDIPYLVQEFLMGEDLSRLILRRESMAAQRIAAILLDVARGLAHAHDHGVLHRDVKPGNVRVLPTGEIKILDFGIARLRDHKSGITSEGVTLGTVGYLAPEQLSGGVADERSDIFSFGILAYELLCFEKPFSGETFSQVSYKLLFEQPPPLAERVEGCPPRLAALIERCLAKKPDARYASFHQIIRELERLLESSREEAAITEILPVAPAPRRRLAMIAGPVAGVLLLFAAFLWWRQSPLGPSSEQAAPTSSAVEPSRLGRPGSPPAAGSPAEMGEPSQAPVTNGEAASIDSAALARPRVDAPGPRAGKPALQSGEDGLPSPPPSAPPPVAEGADPAVARPDGAIAEARRGADPAEAAVLDQAAPGAGREPDTPAADAAEGSLEDGAALGAGQDESRQDEQDEPAPASQILPGVAAVPGNVAGDGDRTAEAAVGEAASPAAGPPRGTPALPAEMPETSEVLPVLIERAEPDYPPRARRRRLEGTVIVLAFVGPSGRVDRTLVRSSTTAGVGFEEAAIEAARRCRFEPGTRDGEPSGFWRELAFEFSVR